MRILVDTTSVFQRFVQDLILDGSFTVSSLAPEDMLAVIENAVKFQLDFDDAYQYVAAIKFDLRIVSHDSDFDRIPGGRLLPGDVFQ